MKKSGLKLGGCLLLSLVLVAAAVQAGAKESTTPGQQLVTGFTAIATGQSARLTVINVSGESSPSSEPVFIELSIYDADGAVLARLQPSDPCLPGQSYNVVWINPAPSGATPTYVRAAIKVWPATDLWSFQSVFVKGSLETIDADGATKIWNQPNPFYPALSVLFPPHPVYPLLPGPVNVSSGQSLVYTLFSPAPAVSSCLPTVKWVDAQGNPAPSNTQETPLIPLNPAEPTNAQMSYFFPFTPTTPGQYRPVVSFAGCSKAPANTSSFIPSEMLLDNSTGRVALQWPMSPSFPPSPIF